MMGDSSVTEGSDSPYDDDVHTLGELVLSTELVRTICAAKLLRRGVPGAVESCEIAGISKFGRIGEPSNVVSSWWGVALTGVLVSCQPLVS